MGLGTSLHNGTGDFIVLSIKESYIEFRYVSDGTGDFIALIIKESYVEFRYVCGWVCMRMHDVCMCMHDVCVYAHA